jgi:GTPase SAR1 family protein
LCRIIKKGYKTRKGLFVPKITCKYLFAAELSFVFTLAGQTNWKPDADMLKWLGFSNDDDALIDSYIKTEREQPETLVAFTENIKTKHFAQTVMPLSDFIVRENNYYKLPRVNVSVYATMSAGKSTFVNALLGYDYLPSRNEACTAKVTSIYDNDYIDYVAGYAVKNGNKKFCGKVDRAVLEAWNNDSEIQEVVLEGDLDNIKHEKTVFAVHDTPGVNYAGNKLHRDITLAHLENVKPDIVICLFEASQLWTTDWKNALSDLKNSLEDFYVKRVIFVLNRADDFDNEKESIGEAATRLKQELEKTGFKDVIVIPASAKAARLFKMSLKRDSEFTQDESDDFSLLMRKLLKDKNNFPALAKGEIEQSLFEIQSQPYNDDLVTVVGDDEYRCVDIYHALTSSGIPLIENLLNCFGGNK